MDDRYKFRAWLPVLKKMVYPIALYFGIRGIAIEYEEDDKRCLDGPGWFELMQCTGLSAVKSYRGDKPEDLLIFENDILRIEWDGYTYEHPVTWDTRKAQWRCGGDGLYVTAHYEPEIIGTIYDKACDEK